MDDLVRLRDSGATDLERELLDSAAEDAPSPAARARTLVALGVATSVVAAAPAAKAATAALAAKGTAAGTAGAAGVVGAAGAIQGAGVGTAASGLVLMKWLGVGAAIGLVTAGGATLMTHRMDAPPPPAVVRAPVVVPAAPEVSAPASARSGAASPLRPVDEPPSGVVAAPAAPARPGRVELPALEPPASPSPTTAALPDVPSSNVAEEVASLDRARAALAAGDAPTTLARLAAHDRAFPGGALEPEAVLLRVRALRELGRTAEARAVAERYLATHPSGAQSSRLRALLDAR